MPGFLPADAASIRPAYPGRINAVLLAAWSRRGGQQEFADYTSTIKREYQAGYEVTYRGEAGNTLRRDAFSCFKTDLRTKVCCDPHATESLDAMPSATSWHRFLPPLKQIRLLEFPMPTL
jgi:hypothetical protein